jgi:diamine N-acetyltransferase
VLTLAEHPDGGAPVGYTLLTPPDLPLPIGPQDIELRRIYTLDLTRGTGLGSALMARAITDARTLGHTRLLLGVLATNTRARSFYERQGFALAGERRFLVGRSWYDDVVYARGV